MLRPKAMKEEQSEHLEEQEPKNGEILEKTPDAAAEGAQPDVPLEDMTREQVAAKIEELRQSAAQSRDLYVRSQADMENLKKRFMKEKADLAKFSNESLIKQLLTVLDNLDQALAHSGEDTDPGKVREGVELTAKGLMDTLAKSGLEEVDALGTPFDPNFHEAMAEINDDTAQPKTVVQVFQKGYLLNGRLIRAAKVIVSRNSSSE